VAKSGATVVYAGPATAFTGMQFPTWVGGYLEVVGVTAVTAGVTRYQLMHHTATGAVTPYCVDGSGAVPLKGRWTSTGLHVDDNLISFACPDAVAFKCTDWGYIAGNAPGSDAWNHHQACTRMARADYCGDGKPHTFDETRIVIRDMYPGAEPNLDNPNIDPLVVSPPPPAPPDNFWFEAAWTASIPPAKCLSKVRWASMPLDGPCPGVLDDPRTINGALYCEDIWPDGITPDGSTLLWNSSMVGQMYLNRWTNGSGQQLVTVRGWHDPQHGDDPPYPNYTNYRGAIGLLMRNPPGSIPPTDLSQIDSQRNPTTLDRYVGFPDVGYNDQGFEGSVYKYAAAGRLPLYLYVNGTDRVTSTAPPPGFPAAPAAMLGYIDPP